MSVSDIKPWFQEDIARMLAAIYFSSAQNSNTSEYREGFATALSAMALAVGINPETFISGQDIQLMRK